MIETVSERQRERERFWVTIGQSRVHDCVLHYNTNEALSCKTLGELALKLVQCDGANLALARHLE